MPFLAFILTIAQKLGLGQILLTAVVKVALPLITDHLKNNDHVQAAEALLTKGAEGIVSDAKNLKTYSDPVKDYPTAASKNNPFGQP